MKTLIVYYSQSENTAFAARAIAERLGADALRRLALRNVVLETEDAAKTLCVTVNPVSAYGWRFDERAFADAMAAAVDVPVINVKEDAL